MSYTKIPVLSTVVILSLALFFGINYAVFAEQPGYDYDTGDHILIGLPVALFKTDNHVYEIQYDITNGKIGASLVDLPAKELIFTINATGDGHLTVYLPREFIDSKRNGMDKPYLVYVGDLNSGLKRTTADEIGNDSQMRVLTINFTRGENEIGIIGTYFIENKSQDVPINLFGNFSPRMQFEKGIDSEDVICKENLQLIIKSSNGHPACVKSSSISKLIARGWTDWRLPLSEEEQSVIVNIATHDPSVQKLLSGKDWYVRAIQSGVSNDKECSFGSCLFILIDQVNKNQTLVVLVNSENNKVIDVKTTPGW
ncbi:MAG TPA: hypothetical protein VLD38_04315 [Nitrosopumilaceae archaeon]|nr:hypothetical protein [Nitrosopumilaceae archaeon]